MKRLLADCYESRATEEEKKQEERKKEQREKKLVLSLFCADEMLAWLNPSQRVLTLCLEAKDTL